MAFEIFKRLITFIFMKICLLVFMVSLGGNEHEASLSSQDDIFRGIFADTLDDLIDVVPGQPTDVFSTSLMSNKSGLNSLYSFESHNFTAYVSRCFLLNHINYFETSFSYDNIVQCL